MLGIIHDEYRFVVHIGQDGFIFGAQIIARALGLPQQAYSRVAHATGTGTSILRTMSMEEVEIINSLYQEDFRKLGYLMLR